jgi:hypothetical protein
MVSFDLHYNTSYKYDLANINPVKSASFSIYLAVTICLTSLCYSEYDIIKCRSRWEEPDLLLANTLYYLF